LRPKSSQYFVSAIIGSPFGLDGRVKITSLSGEDGHFYKLTKVILRTKNEETEKEFLIEKVSSPPLSIKFSGIDSLDAAKALNGAEILLPRKQAAPLQKGDFYIEDLKGMEVIYGNTIIGTISDIIEGGGAFLAELLLESGSKKLVPFRNEFFGQIDINSNRAELLNTWILE